MSSLTLLQPSGIWTYFDQITQVPRPSKKEEKIRAYLLEFAKLHQLEHHVDKIGNVVIYKPATPGRELSTTVILQSHMDMVCEKNSDVEFDFENDPIQTRIDEGWVKATGATLGGDCGIGMAAALAVLAASYLEHGPIEALFTVDEETGLTGAFHLDDTMLSGRYLINLDSEEEGEIFIGCAGGIDTLATLTYVPETLEGDYLYFRVDVKGLKGGHSGDDIEKGLGNSNKLLNRFLWYATRNFGLRLARFDGGNLRNAIPREAYAEFAIPAHVVKPLLAYFEEYREQITAEYQTTEPLMEVLLSEVPQPERFIDLNTQNELLNAVCGLPNGVLAMSRVMENLVETSTNLASVKFQGDNQISIVTSQRSSVHSARDEAAASVRSVLELAGAAVEHTDGYPGWNPNPDSYLLEQTKMCYKKLFWEDPKVRAIHAGLECGLFLEKYPHLEMVSFGPTLLGAHSPDERLEIASVEKFWKLLVELLQSLK